MSAQLTRLLGVGVFMITTACGESENVTPSSKSEDTGGTEEAEALTDCERLGLPVRDFDPETSMVPLRHNPAGDFTVPLLNGTEWTLSEQWSGCESYIFLPHWLVVDEADNRSWWVNGIDGLIDKSPANVHYFFVVAGNNLEPELANDLATNIGENLAPLLADEREWWSDRLHVVDGTSDEIEGLVGLMFRGGIGTYGMAIDRFQKIRTLGSMAAVDAYDAALEWPWERRIYEAGYQPEYYNFEAEREARLESEDALVVEVLGGDVVAGFEDGTLALPDNIQDYDTLEIDVIMECPNRNGVEIGNCGPWDYLAHMWLWEDFDTDGRKDVPEEASPMPDDTGSDATDEDTGRDATDEDTGGDSTDEDTASGTAVSDDPTSVDTGDVDTEADGGSIDMDEDTGTEPDDSGTADTDEVPEEPAEPEPPTGRWVEMARFITTYHRESRWVVDASHALAWLQAGGERTVRYEWAPSWNTQPTAVTTRFRFSNRGKNEVIRSSADLFTGGNFNTTYNDRDPIEVNIPADATKVELVSIITGHGMATRNCAEFCVHSHHFTVNGNEYSVEFNEPGNQSGCAETVGEGTVPNQAGTWWYGRGGWCPGREVDPHIMDVTDQVTPGETATIGYQAKLQGGDLIDDAGNIRLSSWLVFHQ